MAVTATALTSSFSISNLSVYTTASITPTADNLVLLAVGHQEASPYETLTPTGNGLTWVEVASVEASGTGTQKLWLYRAMHASPSAGVVTLTFGGTVNSCIWSINEFAGIDTGGADGADAIVQSVADTTSVSQTSFTVNLAGFGDASNATYGAFYRNAIAAISPGAGFTELHDTSDAEGRRMQSEWRNDNDQTVDATNGGSSRWLGIGAEIKAATGGSTNTGIWGAPIV